MSQMSKIDHQSGVPLSAILLALQSLGLGDLLDNGADGMKFAFLNICSVDNFPTGL